MGFYDRMPYSNAEILNLEWVLQEMKRTAEKVDGLLDDVEAIVTAAEDRIDGKVQAEIDKVMGEIQGVISAFQDRINAQIDENLRKMAELEGKVNGALTDIDGKLAAQAAENQKVLLEFQTAINAEIAELAKEIRRYDVEIKAYIEQRFKDLIDMIPDVTMVWVHNPLTGIPEPVEDTMFYCNNYWLNHGMTLQMFEECGFKAGEFHPEAWEFDTNGGYDYEAPGIGPEASHGRDSVFDDLIELARRTVPYGIEIDNFDKLEYTVSEIEDLALPALQFDLYGLWEFADEPLSDGRYTGDVKMYERRNGVSFSGMVTVADGGVVAGRDFKLLCPIGRGNEAPEFHERLFSSKRIKQVFNAEIWCAVNGNFEIRPVENWEYHDYHFGVAMHDKQMWLVAEIDDAVPNVPFEFYWEFNPKMLDSRVAV